MSIEAKVAEWYEKHARDPEYQAEVLSLAATEAIARAMQEAGLSKAELARRMGVSKARITHLLNGTPNVTLRTLASVGVALGSTFELRLSDVAEPWVKDAVVYHLDVSRITNKFDSDLSPTSSQGGGPVRHVVSKKLRIARSEGFVSEHPAA